MKFKKLVILLIVLMVIAGVAVLQKSADHHNGDITTKPRESAPIITQALSVHALQAIEIQKGADVTHAVHLVKSAEGSWRIESHFNAKAKAGMIEYFLKNLGQLKGELRSDSADVLKDYKLGDAEAIHIKLMGSDKNEVLHLLVSELRPNAEENFVAISGSPKVYAATPDILASVGLYQKDSALGPKVFLDTQVVDFDLNQVTKFRLGEASPLIFVKKKNASGVDAWTFEGSPETEALDESKVRQTLASLSGLYATDVINPNAFTGTRSSPAWASLEYEKDGKKISREIKLGVKNETKKTCQVLALPDNLVYEVSLSQIESIKKDKQFFIKETQSQTSISK